MDTVNNTVLAALKKEAEITTVVIPEAAELTDGYADFYTAILSHCTANNRFAILDMPKDVDKTDFRTQMGSTHTGRQLTGMTIHQGTPDSEPPGNFGQKRYQRLCIRIE